MTRPRPRRTWARSPRLSCHLAHIHSSLENTHTHIRRTDSTLHISRCVRMSCHFNIHTLWTNTGARTLGEPWGTNKRDTDYFMEPMHCFPFCPLGGNSHTGTAATSSKPLLFVSFHPHLLPIIPISLFPGRIHQPPVIFHGEFRLQI